MRIKDFITDKKYLSQRNRLCREKESLKLKRQRDTKNLDWLELSKNCFIFANRAKFWFTSGDLEQKRLVLKSTGSNFLLKDKILNIQLLKPFSIIEDGRKNRSWCPLVHDVRTFFEEGGEEVAGHLGKLKAINDNEYGEDTKAA